MAFYKKRVMQQKQREPSVKSIHLLYNPKAGDKEYSLEKLVALIKAEGYQCGYSSTKDEEMEAFKTQSDLIVAAGGDGTVKKMVNLLRKGRRKELPPLTILPLGTANNISRTLGIEGKIEEMIASWKNWDLRSYDLGEIKGLRDPAFLMEGLGFGLFPYLMHEMNKLDYTPNSSGESLQNALELLRRILTEYKPHFCELQIDDSDHSGKFLLAEIMNIRSIGPNLNLSPLSDPGDGEFEIVLLPKSQKEKFLAYVEAKLRGEEELFSYHTLKGKRICISWEGTHMHVDDKVIKAEKGARVKIVLKENQLRFLAPEPPGK